MTSATTTYPATRRTGIAVGIFAAGFLLILGTASPAHAADLPVNLGSADSYEVLAGSTITNTGPTVITNGDIGLSPGTAITGFPPGTISGGVIHATDAQAQLAQSDLTIAYLDAAGRTPATTISGDTLAGLTLVPGVYKGGALDLTGTLTLNGTGDSVWIFQAASTLTAASNSVVAFTGPDGDVPGPCNVFWQVGSSAVIGTTAHFAGTVMALTSITLNTGAVVDGRMLARNGAVTLDSVTLTRPADCAARTAIVASTPTAEQIAAAQAAAAAAAAARLAATGASPIPGLATAAGLLLLGGVLIVDSRLRRRLAGMPRE